MTREEIKLRVYPLASLRAILSPSELWKRWRKKRKRAKQAAFWKMASGMGQRSPAERRRRRRSRHVLSMHARCRHRNLTRRHYCRACGRHGLLLPPYHQGVVAGHEGRPQFVNPYRHGRAVWSWRLGWIRGRLSRPLVPESPRAIKPVFEKAEVA
jgi:hypothetical protein